MRYRWCVLGGSVLLGLSLSACTADADPSDGRDADPSRTATVTVYDDGVRLAGTAGSSSAAHTGTVVSAGGRIEVDASGFASIALGGRATARIAADGELQVGRIDATSIAVTAGGTTWHRVAGGATSYRVSTPVAAYETTGAAFGLDCTGRTRCDLMVAAGAVRVTPHGAQAVTVGAMQSLTVAAGAAVGVPAIYPMSALYADEWTATNLALDAVGGGTSGVPRLDAASPAVLAAATLTGTWSVDSVVTGSTDPTAPPGTKTHRDWEFGDADCAAVACTVPLTRTFGAVGKAGTDTAKEQLGYSAQGFRAHHERLSACTDGSGAVLAEKYFHESNTMELRVVDVKVTGGTPVATRFEGTSTSTVEFAGEPTVPGCYLNSLDPIVQTVVGVRVDTVVPPVLPQPPAPMPPPSVHAAPASTLGDSPHAPSVLSSLTTAQDLDASVARVAGTGALAVILLLIVGYPAHLLNATISDNYERIFRWVPAVRRRLGPAGRGTRLPRRGAVVGGIVTASVIAAFIDPGFGINAASGRMLASVAISFIVGSLCAWLLIAAIVRRTEPASSPKVRFRYGSLLIVTAAVLFSRFTGFAPGMVFGMVVGLTLGVTLATAKQARITLVGLGYAAGVSVVSWLAYSGLTAVFDDTPGATQVFVLETLSAFAVGGFAALPIALLPMAVLDGGALFAWRKAIWALAYAVGLFVFLLILLPLPSSWGNTATPFGTWLVIYIAFGLFAVAMWAYFRAVPPRRAVGARAQQTAGEDARA